MADQPNVDSVSGFHEALIAAAGGELTDEARDVLEQQGQDRSVSSGLTQDEETSPASAPQSAEEPVAEEEEEEVAPPAEEEQAGGQTPDFQQGYLKALGEQSQALGEERARREALEQRLAALEKGREEEEAPTGIYFPNESEWESLTDQFDNLGGPSLMSRVAASNPDQYDAALALWKAGGDTDIASAYLYEANVERLMQTGSEEDDPAAPELPQEVQDLVAAQKMQKTFEGLAANLDPQVAKAISPHIETALAEASPLVQQGISNAFASDDPKQHEMGFNEIVRLASAKAQVAAAAPVQQEQRVAAKRRATVATGSARPVQSGQAGNELPKSLTEFEAVRKEDPVRAKRLASALVAKQFEETDTTSVAEGLKQGRG